MNAGFRPTNFLGQIGAKFAPALSVWAPIGLNTFDEILPPDVSSENEIIRYIQENPATYSSDLARSLFERSGVQVQNAAARFQRSVTQEIDRFSPFILDRDLREGLAKGFPISDDLVLHIVPGKTLSWRQFKWNTPRRSIALDGVVTGGPENDTLSLHVNFDHHSDVKRWATESTCMQMFMAIHQYNIMRYYKTNSHKVVHLYNNDIDQDTAAAIYVAKNHEMIRDFNNPENRDKLARLYKLLEHTNKLDITAGFFRRDLSDPFETVATWIYEPYNAFRREGLLARACARDMAAVLEEVMQRIDDYVQGKVTEASLIATSQRYTSIMDVDVLFDQRRFMVVKENDMQARDILFDRFPDAELIVSQIATRPDKRHVYSLLMPSHFANLITLPEVYRILNQAEGKRVWAGGEDGAGGCRNLGSRLSPQEINDVITAYVQNKDNG